MNTANIEQFDEWLKHGSEIAALVMRQRLESVEGRDAVIFPPTYAKPERVREEDWMGYNIDHFGDGSNVCLLDSVGSQANRMEPVFMRKPYDELVPQVIIKVRKGDGQDRQVHLLEAGHRAGDAIARFAGKPEGDEDGKALAEMLWEAFKAWQESGNAEPLARIAPTSLVFGAWDSRATQAKVPRIVRSVIRAYNVRPHHRSAQFNTPLHYVDEGLIDPSLDKGGEEKNPLAQEGFRHSPAAWAHGGVQVLGEIRRDVSLNLVALRSLGAKPKPEETEERTMALRRYILGLALVAVTQRHDQMFNLREGCLLRIVESSPWRLIPFEGAEREISISDNHALEFAKAAAKKFGVEKLATPFVFDSQKAEQWLKLDKKERDKRRRNGPVIKQDL
jgi:CRISPR-associated protein Csb1